MHINVEVRVVVCILFLVCTVDGYGKSGSAVMHGMT